MRTACWIGAPDRALARACESGCIRARLRAHLIFGDSAGDSSDPARRYIVAATTVCPCRPRQPAAFA